MNNSTIIKSIICFGFALLATTGLVIADPITHKKTKITFPDAIGGYERHGEFRDFETRSPGMGYSCAYTDKSSTTATIYIYNLGMEETPTDIEHPFMTELRELTVREVERFAQSTGATLKQTLKETITVPGKAKPISVFMDGFILNNSSGETNTFTLSWPSRNHFMKIRITYQPNTKVDAKVMKEFYEQIVLLSTP